MDSAERALLEEALRKSLTTSGPEAEPGAALAELGRAEMLALAREHVLEREQFRRPLASFQALRHRLAETHVALEAAEAVLVAPGSPQSHSAGRHGTAATQDTAALLAKAAAGRAALTAEHALHRHIKRALVLDGLLGSTRELTREAARLLLRETRAPRLVDL